MEVVALSETLVRTDLVDISTAGGTEMLLPVWLRLMSALGTVAFNFKIVR